MKIYETVKPNKNGNTIRKYLLASSISMALFAFNSAGNAQSSQEVSTSEQQESQLSSTYSMSPYLRTSDIVVEVDDGNATLTGVVEGEAYKELAEQMALAVDGIEHVDNQIEVNEDLASLNSEHDRSLGVVFDDASITAAVKSKLLWSRHAEGLATNVDTYEGKVTLSGTATSGAARELAESLAMNTNGVMAVDNQLEVIEPESGIAVENEVSHSVASDAWITSKIKATYVFSSNVDSSDISVTTEEGIVTLTGDVESGVEHELAVELAQNIRGVERVDAEDLVF